jgi:hypothetical protein
MDPRRGEQTSAQLWPDYLLSGRLHAIAVDLALQQRAITRAVRSRPIQARAIVK